MYIYATNTNPCIPMLPIQTHVHLCYQYKPMYTYATNAYPCTHSIKAVPKKKCTNSETSAGCEFIVMHTFNAKIGLDFMHILLLPRAAIHPNKPCSMLMHIILMLLYMYVAHCVCTVHIQVIWSVCLFNNTVETMIIITSTSPSSHAVQSCSN